MKIHRLSLDSGAKQARGTAVIIDVFRAFTCEPLMYHLGAREIIVESDVGKCRIIDPDGILVGEIDGIDIEGFDLGNSPARIMERGRPYFSGKRVIHRSTSGVTGTLAAMEHADEVLVGSFINAAATCAYIREMSPDEVSIVAMGVVPDKITTPEDEFCGDYMEHLLTGRPYDHVAALDAILSDESAQKFLRGDKAWYPREDVVYCLQRDSLNCVLRATSENGHVIVRKVD